MQWLQFTVAALPVIAAWSWVLRKVRKHHVAEAETQESRFAEIREAIRRADEAPASEQERVETAARMTP